MLFFKICPIAGLTTNVTKEWLSVSFVVSVKIFGQIIVNEKKYKGWCQS